MATITSAASGNFSAGATWVGGVVPSVADDAVAANGHTVVIDTNVTVLSFQQAGTGKFTLGNGRNVTGNVIANAGTFTSGGTIEVICGVGESATLNGNVTGVSSTAVNIAGIVVSGVGSFTLNGSVTGSPGNAASEGNGHAGIYTNVASTIVINGMVSGLGLHKRAIQAGPSSGAASITVNGDVYGGSQNAYGIYHQGTSGVVTCTSTTIQAGGSQAAYGILHIGTSGVINCTAASVQGGNGTIAYGVIHTGASGIVNCTAASVQGGSGSNAYGIMHTGASGTVNCTATTIQGGGGGTSHGILHQGSSGTVVSVGNVQSTSSSNGIWSDNTSSAAGVFHTGSITDSTSGRVAIRTTFLRVAPGTGTTTYATAGIPTGTANPRFSPDQILGVPATNNVRAGTVYGNPATLTGTLAVPPANAVSAGVPVDNTVGTAALTPEDIAGVVGAQIAAALTSPT